MDSLINRIIKKMIYTSQGNRHDIEHFLKVHSYARLIGESEIADFKSREILELAAILHDIACPLCREKYGSAKGVLQEIEGMPLCREFLAEFQLDNDVVEKVVWLVGHHHTVEENLSVEHRILLEADLLVNASESEYTNERLCLEAAQVFRTKTGTELLRSIYMIKEGHNA